MVKAKKQPRKKPLCPKRELKVVHDVLSRKLSRDVLQNLSNCCFTINESLKGDGCGLSGGFLIEQTLSEFLKKHMNGVYEKFNCGESDMKISGIPLSLKKISGKSSMALSWSKNKIKDEEKCNFNSHIMIINIKTEQWWKNRPLKLNSNNICHNKICFNDTIPSGLYLVDRMFCKRFVKTLSNNKSDTMIDQQNLYIMVKKSMLQKTYIELPEPTKKGTFNILNAISFK
jgi:hypothetical protein